MPINAIGEAGIIATPRYDQEPPTTTDLRFINWIVNRTTEAYEKRGHRIANVTPILTHLGYCQLWISSPDGHRTAYAAVEADDERTWYIVDRGYTASGAHPAPAEYD